MDAPGYGFHAMMDPRRRSCCGARRHQPHEPECHSAESMCYDCGDDPVLYADLCERCFDEEIKRLVRRRITEDGGDCGYTHDQLRRMIAAEMLEVRS